ncbi:Outer membrane protein TolC [Bacteroides faecichinchillae]|uniref:Outer membrane protein TolC n=1 Tax=Bacteroides faecichinchillae TaxID=871325 RepID=A0A1M4YH75_9BACE|nr:TolC family protein [Bacteroides faecichinchillae]THG67618.1 TolC family protein [Bacteroides faecichinchillae]SHF05194.1 Outer membrane protein TolC [Bacteroides faecichinchillae]
MKRIIIISFVLLILTSGVQAQNGIDQVLRNIETNNKGLQANAQLIASQKLEAKTENNLADPTLSYAHLWGAKDKSETIGELVISQSFDFPSLYITRNKLNRLKSEAFDSQADIFRQDMLLQAKEICLDIIMLRQQKQILEERLRNAEELSKMYAKRLQTGDANALETNKINLELLNVRTEASLNETTLRNRLQELNALNGNIPVVFEETKYPTAPLPADYQILKSEVMASDRTLMAIGNESLVAHKQISVNKSQWLPKLELGYRRNTETGAPFNGVVVGLSFPLFENRNKVKVAKAQALNIDLQKQDATFQVESELTQLYREAKSLHTSMEEYQKTFQSQQDLKLLKQALTGGQISMIEYFVEVSVLYQSHLNYLQLENQYQKAMARIYKSNL